MTKKIKKSLVVRNKFVVKSKIKAIDIVVSDDKGKMTAMLDVRKQTIQIDLSVYDYMEVEKILTLSNALRLVALEAKKILKNEQKNNK
jgi:hypothetical protein